MKIQAILKQNIWLVILLAVFISFVWPKPGLIIEPYIAYLLMLLMFLSCLDVSLRQIRKTLHEYKKLTLIFGIIHLVSPILVLFLKPFFSDEIFLGLIMATTVCSGMAVIFLSYLYGGLPSKALVITFISNILSPLIVPLLVLQFAQTSIKIDAVAMSITIIKLVVIPVALARLLSRSKIKQFLCDCSSGVSILLLFLIMLGVVSPIKDMILNNIALSLWLFLISIVLITINFSLGYWLGKGRKEKITFGISASYKNFTLALVVTLSLFSPAVALPVVVFAVTDNLFLIPLQLVFLRKKRGILDKMREII